MNQDIIKNINSSKTSNEILTVIKNLPTRKSPGLHGFTAEFYWTFKVELIPMLLKLFHKVQKEGILPNTFYKVSVTLIPKPDKDTSKNKGIGQHSW
jgi:hypothetical protein